jgi:hypothetical protein
VHVWWSYNARKGAKVSNFLSWDVSHHLAASVSINNESIMKPDWNSRDLCNCVSWHQWEREDDRELGRRMNMVQIMYTHVCKCKNDTCWNNSSNQGRGEWKKGVEGVNSHMMYLIHCKNLCKCYNVPSPSTTIKIFSIN